MINGLNSFLSPNRFISTDVEELTALELIGTQNAKINEVVKGHNSLDEKKVDKGSNFEGSWHGITHPVFADPGIAGVVEKNVSDIEKNNSDIENIKVEITTVKNELNSNFPSRLITKLRGNENVTVICKGDSMTYGTVQGGQASLNYPFVLEYKMKYIYDNQNITVLNKGVGGTTTQYALDTINDDISLNPDIVFMMYGLNDSVDGGVDIVTFEHNLNKIVKTYLEHNIEVVLLTPVPIISKTLGVDYEINVEQYCKIIKKVCEYNKLLCVDVYAEMQNLMANYLVTTSNYDITGHLKDYSIVADIVLKNIISYKCDFKRGEFIPFDTNLAFNTCCSKNVVSEGCDYMNVFYKISMGDNSVIKFAYFHNQRGAKLNLNVHDKSDGGGGWLLNFGSNYFNIANNGVSNPNKLFEVPLLGCGLYLFEVNGSSITVGSFEVSGVVIK